MRHEFQALALFALMLGLVPGAGAVPAVFDVRYEFTTDNIFLATFGVQATVTGVARYSLDETDQLPAEPLTGLYSLTSHRIRIDGVSSSASADPFGYYNSSVSVLNDVGGADGFWLESTFNQGFGNGLTLTSVGVALFGPSDVLSSDAIFRLDPAAFPDQQGLIRYLPAGATLPSEALDIFAFSLTSIRVTPVPEPGTLGLLGIGLAGLGLSRRLKGT